ncbi:MAG: DUF4396 domain-containing protein [Candidatus Dormiibacterota bacterium]
MGVMDFVFPITALYLGPLALAMYWRWGRVDARMTTASMSMSWTALSRAAAASAGDSMRIHGDQSAYHEMAGAAGPHGTDRPIPPDQRTRPRWVTLAIEVSHCGAGCTVGDVISEFAIFGLGLTIAGVTLGAEYVGDYVLALAFGIVFQYFAIAPMRGLGLKEGLIAAAKADFISLTAFEIGLFGWMAIMAFVLIPAPHHLMPNSAAYWLLMQIGMIVGYFTSWPANVWLVNRGIKVPM